MRELALFAGAGGGLLGGKLLGWKCVCAVEIDPYARHVLLARQADGCLEPFPIWDDVTTFNGHRWRGSVDVVSGGFPCQDISAAGKGAGLDGAKSGLWSEFARIIGEVQPAFVWVENSPILVVRGLDRVLWDLAALGYDARWGVVSAADAGLSHLRKRIWILAYANSESRSDRGLGPKDCGNSTFWRRFEEEWGKDRVFSALGTETLRRLGMEWRKGNGQPRARGIVDGLAYQMERNHAVGNGQVPAVVKLAWDTLASGL